MDQHLFTFIMVAEKKNFTRAAEALHITPSAVSKEIESLEQKYGAKLCDRTNKYVHLTEAGEILYYHAKDILDKYACIQRLIDDLSQSAVGNISIGSGYTFGEYLLPKRLAEFKYNYPLVTPKITIMNSSRIMMKVIRHEIDVGIIEGKNNPPGMKVQPFATDELVVILPPTHRLSHCQEVDIKELISETWILRENGSGTREIADRIFLDFGLTPPPIMEFGSSQTIKQAVISELGISVLSQSIIQKEIEYQQLCAVRIKDYPIQRSFSWMIHPSKFKTKALELFLDFLSIS